MNRDATKKAVDTATARFVRRAAGRISQGDARKLGKMYGADLHWKYLGTAGDRLEERARRGAGAFAHDWRAYLKHYIGEGPRTPGETCELARHLARLFCWYGPNSGQWPGDVLVLAPPQPNGFGGGWRVMCAADCPCGHCYRPAIAVTIELVDRMPPRENEGSVAYYARLTARPSVAKASDRPRVAA